MKRNPASEVFGGMTKKKPQLDGLFNIYICTFKNGFSSRSDIQVIVLAKDMQAVVSTCPTATTIERMTPAQIVINKAVAQDMYKAMRGGDAELNPEGV